MFTSLPTRTVVPSRRPSSSASGKETPAQPLRFAALVTTPVAWSTSPGEHAPTPGSVDSSTPASPAASPSASVIACRDGRWAALRGVAPRAVPSGRCSASTTTA